MNKFECDEAFRQAIGHQQQGRIDEAQGLYEAVLKSDPNNHYCLQLLGVIASQRGNHFYARRLLESSLVHLPADADALANLGQVLFYLGEHEQALQRCEQSLAVHADNPICHLTRGKTLCHLSRYAEGKAALDEVLRLKPDMTEALVYRGFCQHNLGHFEPALEDYRDALRLRPDHAEALSHQAHALFSLHRLPEAHHSLDAALSVWPDFPEAHFHRGLFLQHENRLDEAEVCYRHALDLNPHYPQALENLAFVLHKLARSDQECVALLDRCLKIKPHAVAALKARASLLVGLRMLEEAMADYDLAAALDPDDARTQVYRAETLLLRRRPAEAIAAFRRAKELGAEGDDLDYALASLGEAPAPNSAPATYVVKLFDWYARHFDDHLQGSLAYRTPALLMGQVAALQPGDQLDIADLGCGTGLCGPLLKPMARQLVGVDLSPNMLEVAKERGLYDELVCSDLLSFLVRSVDRFDLVVAADVFVYVGALEVVFRATRQAMRHGGLFSFSFEASEDQDLVLRSSRRYAHSVSYIERLAASHGFEVLRMESSVIRKEAGEDMHGFLTTLRAA